MTNLTTKQTDKTVSACVWCGKAYEEHRDKPFPNGAVAKTPCGLMKSGFYAKNPTTHSPTETVSDKKCGCACHRIVPDELNNCDCIRFHTSLSEHDLELIREGRAMSDRDTRRGE